MTAAASVAVKSTNVRSWVGTVPRMLGGAVRALSLLSTQWAALAALRLFTFPTRHRAPSREAASVGQSRPMPIPFGRGALAARAWGEGHRTVLLVHGWSGRAGQMGAIGEALAEAGLRAVAVELPGHGGSPGRTLNLFEAADAVAAAVRHVGPVEAIVAHSFGVPASVYAMRTGFPLDRLVAVAPADPARAVPRFTRILGLGGHLRTAMLDLLARRFGIPLEALELAHMARDLELPGLVIHDRLDPMIAFADAQRLHASWTRSSLMATEGLGHGRILRDPAVVAAIVEFVTDDGRLRCSA